jgi:hypothetical protein
MVFLVANVMTLLYHALIMAVAVESVLFGVSRFHLVLMGMGVRGESPRAEEVGPEGAQ